MANSPDGCDRDQRRLTQQPSGKAKKHPGRQCYGDRGLWGSKSIYRQTATWLKVTVEALRKGTLSSYREQVRQGSWKTTTKPTRRKQDS